MYLQSDELESEERMVLRQLETAKAELQRTFTDLAKRGLKFELNHQAINLAAVGAFSGRKWQVEVRFP